VRRLLVIGGRGFIGRVLCRVARAHGVDVVSADSSGGKEGSTHRHVDVTDPESVRRLFAESHPDAVVSLAAHGDGERGLLAGAQTDPVRAVDVNVRGVALVIRESAAAGCRHVILTSSTTVYGPANCYSEPVDEQVRLRPATMYGGTKAGAEMAAYPLGQQLGIRVAAIRLPLVYGGERWYGGSQQALVDFVNALSTGRPATVRAWTRPADWMHVTDAACALFEAAASTTAAGPYNVVGHTSSMADLAQALAAQVDTPAEVETVTAGGPDLPLVDDARARRDLQLTVRHDSPTSGANAYLREIRSTP
jgi:nucleoside-diphosphate-sugar epimerase